MITIEALTGKHLMQMLVLPPVKAEDLAKGDV
jgi:hypothetical protein